MNVRVAHGALDQCKVPRIFFRAVALCFGHLSDNLIIEAWRRSDLVCPVISSIETNFCLFGIAFGLVEARCAAPCIYVLVIVRISGVSLWRRRLKCLAWCVL